VIKILKNPFTIQRHVQTLKWTFVSSTNNTIRHIAYSPVPQLNCKLLTAIATDYYSAFSSSCRQKQLSVQNPEASNDECLSQGPYTIHVLL